MRSNSARRIQGDFRQHTQRTSEMIIEESLKAWGRLDLLVNNASEFHPTEVGKITEKEWYGLMEANLCAPFFLSQVNFTNFFVKMLLCSSKKYHIPISNGQSKFSIFLWSGYLLAIFECLLRSSLHSRPVP